ncbi:hypothetical protein MJ575_25500 [Klebsiella pneumoniae]|nr:hypothetical protein MJ575_25500 [Klebsiella pneumoniae]
MPTLAAIDEPQFAAGRRRDPAARGLSAPSAALENLLQSINDEQTQTLPQDELNRARLAWGMATDDWETPMRSLANHRPTYGGVDELIGGDEAQSPG